MQYPRVRIDGVRLFQYVLLWQMLSFLAEAPARTDGTQCAQPAQQAEGCTGTGMHWPSPAPAPASVPAAQPPEGMTTSPHFISVRAQIAGSGSQGF